MSNQEIPNICKSDSFIKDILSKKSFYAEYQPIVDIKTLEIIGYEALSRFKYNGSNIPPKDVFEYCHKNVDLFFALEMDMKKHQFKNRPENAKLFINFDPHVFYKRDGANDVFECFSKHTNFVIELVENSHQSVNIELLIDIFRKFDYKFAIDDFFQDNTLLSIFLLNNCDYLKLDMGILKELKANRSFYLIVDGLVNFAHSNDKLVILEGIENEIDLQIAKDRNIDLLQGFYFEKQFIRK
ncbi:MAG: EAL domain-containing protein [Arcobacteraceae bacterium]|nr:EAL domain-containing protein [Arcobacteraceae bacterium]MDY0327936.1 EAL domain-containing protein [Arcobacteraceae bacterium]